MASATVTCDRDESVDPMVLPKPPSASNLPRMAPSAPAVADLLAATSTLPSPGVPEDPTAQSPVAEVPDHDLEPQMIEASPVLQRWLEAVPDIAHDIDHDPAFRTQVRIGYVEFPSTQHTSGIYLGVQDVFVGPTPLTVSAEYAANGRGDRQVIGADAQYYLLPLGWYANLAPVIGYRSITTPGFETDGVNVGMRLMVMPSRNGAADLSFNQSWVAPGSEREVSITKFTLGYAITQDFRLATDFQWQRTPARNESRVGLLLEWMP